MSDDDIFPIFVTREEYALLYWSLPDGCIAGRRLLRDEWERRSGETAEPPNYYAMTENV